MEQPNVTHDGEAALDGRLWLAVVTSGVATGLLGAGLMWVLAEVGRLAFGVRHDHYAAAVATHSGGWRVAMLALSGVVGAVGWYLIRRFLKGESAEIDDSLWRGDARLSLRRSALTAVLSEVVIGLGASIGREAAPKLMGGAAASRLSDAFGLSDAQRRLVVACAGGAGLACVYNVPLGGALFTCEVLLGSFALPTVLAALATSLIATATAWVYLPTSPTYLDIPAFHLNATLTVFALPAGLVIGAIAITYVRVVGWASHVRARGAHILWVMPLTFVGVGVLGIWYPQLFGNGKDMAHEAFLGLGGAGLLFALFALKPLTTTATLAAGGSGGVFTPFLAVGAVFGALLGVGWSELWPGTPVGAFALVGAAAMIGSSMQAPLAGLVLVLEMTHSSFSLAIPMMAATLIATFLVRQVDGYSIYSARLPRHEEEPAPPAV